MITLVIGSNLLVLFIGEVDFYLTYIGFGIKPRHDAAKAFIMNRIDLG
jgi:hypothetical protein